MKTNVFVYVLLPLVVLCQLFFYKAIEIYMMAHRKAHLRPGKLEIPCNFLRIHNLFNVNLLPKMQERCKFLQKLHKQIEIPICSASVIEMVQHDHQMGEFLRHLQEFVFFLLGHHHTIDPNSNKGELDYVLYSVRRLINALDESRGGSLIHRQQMLRPIKEAILQDLRIFQTPLKCQDHPILVCDGKPFTPTKGFGSRMTYATYCYAAAMASKRRLLLIPANKFLLGGYFLPLSNVCTNHTAAWDPNSNWPLQLPQPAEVMHIDRHRKSNQFSQDMPPHIPLRYDPKRVLFYIMENPIAWYIGILTQDIMRPNEHLEKIINEKYQRLGISMSREKFGKNLTAGIHVRTKFDSNEAPILNVSIYLNVVDEWFKQMDLMVGIQHNRRVFIATEDYNVPRDAKRLFPHYTFLFNESLINNTANNSLDFFDHNYGKFENQSSVLEIITDLMILVKVDFFVGTCSSNIGRTIYQLRMAEDPFWAERTTVSLDMEWYHYHFEHSLIYRAIDRQVGQPESGELTFGLDDQIEGIAVSNLYKVWKSMNRTFLPDGTVYGKLKRKVGIFPRFKVKLDTSKLSQ